MIKSRDGRHYLTEEGEWAPIPPAPAIPLSDTLLHPAMFVVYTFFAIIVIFAIVTVAPHS
jgi:hypothetical protein